MARNSPGSSPGIPREIGRGSPGKSAGILPGDSPGIPPGNLPGTSPWNSRYPSGESTGAFPGNSTGASRELARAGCRPLSRESTGHSPGNSPGTLRGIDRGSSGAFAGQCAEDPPGKLPGICPGNAPLVPSSTTTVAHLRYRSRRTWDRSCSVAPRRPAHQLRAQQRGGRQGALVRFDVQATINVRARSDTVLLISLVISWSLARAEAGH